MSIFPLIPTLIFGAVVLGAGVLLAPGLPPGLPQSAARQTAAPRIGLAAALILACVISGALFLAARFGWASLTFDVLGLVALVAAGLGGRLAFRQSRREAGWPGARELVFFGLVLGLFVLPSLILPVPLDTDARASAIWLTACAKAAP
jgi:hypothetical protein